MLASTRLPRFFIAFITAFITAFPFRQADVPGYNWLARLTADKSRLRYRLIYLPGYVSPVWRYAPS
jgi:hypothetical protein